MLHAREVTGLDYAYSSQMVIETIGQNISSVNLTGNATMMQIISVQPPCQSLFIPKFQLWLLFPYGV